MKPLKLKTPNNNKHKQAFTIIEVVLVLAIAGLIFLMVFIALPALQRNQRDTQRKNDLSRALTAVNSYQSNNKNKRPQLNTTFISDYLTANGDTFKDPDGSSYNFTYAGTIGTIPTERKNPNGIYTYIYVYPSAKCDKENTVASSGINKLAISVILEGGGVYCVNN